MKIRFGMLAVDGVGKAGGQCIQRRGNLRVLRNITIPTQRSASTQNPQRFVNNYLFSKYSNLSEVARAQWTLIGQTLKGSNIWGEEKSYSGREAFLMTNGILYSYENALIAENNFEFTKPVLTVDGMTINRTTAKLIFDVVMDNDNYCYQIKTARLRSLAVNPSITKLKTLIKTADISDSSELYDLLSRAYPTIAVGQIYSIAIRGISRYGLTSLYTQMTVTVI